MLNTRFATDAELTDTVRDDAAFLRGSWQKLAPKDHAFAQSLLAARNPSPKQLHWVSVLADRVRHSDAQPASPEPTADLSAINAMFAKAGGKRAALLFRTDDGSIFRLSLAGQRSAQPGSINVTDNGPGGFDGRLWFGRIGLDGAFQPSRRVEAETTTAVVQALEAFAADPAGQAAAFGLETKQCCFCGHELDNPASKQLGYGPVCAKRWGVAHSYTKPVAALEATAVVEG